MRVEIERAARLVDDGDVFGGEIVGRGAWRAPAGGPGTAAFA